MSDDRPKLEVNWAGKAGHRCVDCRAQAVNECVIERHTVCCIVAGCGKRYNVTKGCEDHSYKDGHNLETQPGPYYNGEHRIHFASYGHLKRTYK